MTNQNDWNEDDDKTLWRHLLDAVESGDLDMLPGDKFRLSEQGQEHAEKLMRISADALEMFFSLTMSNLHLRPKKEETLRTAFDMALTQCRHKDEIIRQLAEELDKRGFDLSQIKV